MHIGTLISYEFRKYFTRFHIILLIIVSAINIGLSIFTFREYFTSDYHAYQLQKNEIINLYSEDSEQYNSILKKHAERVTKYNDDLISSVNTGGFPIFENQYINLGNYGDIQLFADVEKAVNTPVNYSNRMSGILRDALFRLEESDDDSYVGRYYLAFCRKYITVADTEMKSAEVTGWNEFFSFRIPSMMLMIALVGTLCTVFTSDNKAGMGNIIHVSRYGGKAILGSKLIFISGMAAVITIIFSMIPLFILGISCGLSLMDYPVQMVDNLVDCPFRINIGQYLVIYLILRIIVFTALTLTAAVVNQFFDNDKFAFVTVALLVECGIFVGKIPVTSPYYFLQKFSITEIAEINIMFERYRGVNFCGYCLDYTIVVIAAALFIIFMLVILSLFKKTSGLMELSECRSECVYTKQSMSLVQTEFFKHMVCARYMVLALVILIVKIMIAGVYYIPADHYVEEQYKNYIESVSGKITSEKLDMIENEKQYIEKSLTEYQAAKMQYLSGTMNEDEFQDYKNRNNYAEYYEQGCERLCERRDYLVKVSEKYSDVEFIYDKGLELYFDSSIDIPLLILVVFMASNVFPYEYESGIDKLIRTTSEGRRKLFQTKFIYALLTACTVYAISLIIDAGFIACFYDVEYWDVPVQSMPVFETVSENQTIAEYMLKYQIISFIGYVVSFVFVFSLSAILKNQIKTIITTLFIMIIAYCADIFGVLPFSVMNYIEMLSPVYIEKNRISYVTCIIISFFAVITAYNRWVGRKKKI